MLGAKPSLRLIHYHGFIALQPNITPWITILSCHVAVQTSLDQFTVCNFLFVKVQREIILSTGDLRALLAILKGNPMYFVYARIAKRSICYLPNNKQDLLEDKLSVSCCRVAHSLKTTTTLVIMTRGLPLPSIQWDYDAIKWFVVV